ncbi:MAG: RNase adapter RapZ [Acidiferrobacterales bacterium]|nr:RNase adapter RapZ [Acidiferrobacterales bacterium]
MTSSKFFIVSGTSGSGKTIALQVLEDLGFYCIDNLPASLMPEMAARLNKNNQANKSAQNCAISIDSRNQDFIGNLKDSFDSLSSLNIEVFVVFLDADDETLLKRFSETRRKHPLSDKNTSLSEAICKERKLLAHISDIADHHISTTNRTPHELRSIIRNQAANLGEKSLTLLFLSFGFKYGNPGDADFVFDVRCLPNPYWEDDLRELTGLNPSVAEFLSGQPACIDMYEHIGDFIQHWLPNFIEDNRNYITVAIGCTGGKHRSVFLADRLQRHFTTNEKIQIQVRHRELALEMLN